MNILKGKPQMAGKPPSYFPWKAPPPNIYYLKNVIGFIDHDPTKKVSPAYSLVRYVYPPRPKVKVSTAPFIKALRKKQRKGKKSEFVVKPVKKKKKKKKQKQSQGRTKFRRRDDLSNKDITSNIEEEGTNEYEVVDSSPPFRPPPLKYKLTRRTSSVSDLFMMPTGNVKCKSCNVLNFDKTWEDIYKDQRYKNCEIHGVQYVGVAIQNCKEKPKAKRRRKRCKKKIC